MVKKNFLIILVILITILLIASVIWAYHKRIENIENKMQTDKTYSSVKAQK
jgi:cbb3-type cytochrome oxidase subunit 3